MENIPKCRFQLQPNPRSLTFQILLPPFPPNFHLYILVWTPCLMHRCVCIWGYILQNYNYKLHFQSLSIYHIPHVFIGTLATENLDVCTACDSWYSNIQLTMVKDRRWQIYSNVIHCLTLTLVDCHAQSLQSIMDQGRPKRKKLYHGI